MPRSPAIVSIGSPGTSRIRKNASSVIPMNVGMTRLRRVSRKRNIANGPKAAVFKHKSAADPGRGVTPSVGAAAMAFGNS